MQSLLKTDLLNACAILKRVFNDGVVREHPASEKEVPITEKLIQRALTSPEGDEQTRLYFTPRGQLSVERRQVISLETTPEEDEEFNKTILQKNSAGTNTFVRNVALTSDTYLLTTNKEFCAFRNLPSIPVKGAFFDTVEENRNTREKIPVYAPAWGSASKGLRPPGSHTALLGPFHWTPPPGTHLIMVLSGNMRTVKEARNVLSISTRVNVNRAYLYLVDPTKAHDSSPDDQTIGYFRSVYNTEVFLPRMYRPPFPNLDTNAYMCAGTISYDGTKGLESTIQAYINAWGDNQFNDHWSNYHTTQAEWNMMRFKISDGTHRPIAADWASHLNQASLPDSSAHTNNIRRFMPHACAFFNTQKKNQS